MLSEKPVFPRSGCNCEQSSATERLSQRGYHSGHRWIPPCRRIRHLVSANWPIGLLRLLRLAFKTPPLPNSAVSRAAPTPSLRRSNSSSDIRKPLLKCLMTSAAFFQMTSESDHVCFHSSSARCWSKRISYLGRFKLENLCVSRCYHSAVFGACMQIPQFNVLVGKRNAQKKRKKKNLFLVELVRDWRGTCRSAKESRGVLCTRLVPFSLLCLPLKTKNSFHSDTFRPTSQTAFSAVRTSQEVIMIVNEMFLRCPLEMRRREKKGFITADSWHAVWLRFNSAATMTASSAFFFAFFVWNAMHDEVQHKPAALLQMSFFLNKYVGGLLSTELYWISLVVIMNNCHKDSPEVQYSASQQRTYLKTNSAS